MIRNKIILDLLVQKAKKEFEKALDAEKVDKDLGFTLSLGNFPQKIELEFKLSNYSWRNTLKYF